MSNKGYANAWEYFGLQSGIALLEGQRGDYVIADKGYDSQSVVEAVEELGAEAVIPSRSFRKEPRSYDRYL